MSYPGDGRNGQEGGPNWRDLVSTQFHKRRQTPQAAARSAAKLAAKTEALLPIQLPKLPTPGTASRRASEDAELKRSMLKRYTLGKMMEPQHEETRQVEEEQKEEVGESAADELIRRVRGTSREGVTTAASSSSSSSATAAAASPAPTAAGSSSSPARSHSAKVTPPSRSIRSPGGLKIMKLRGGSTQPKGLTAAAITAGLGRRTTNGGTDSAHSIGYAINPSATSTLYKTARSDLESLPLELFDDPALYGDRSGSEWVELGRTKYYGRGTPAKAAFYGNKEYHWAPCRVMDYDEQTQEFLIEFKEENGQTLQKTVKRLSLLFDDEDQDTFHARLEYCRNLRESALSSRRYSSFLSAQPVTVHAPIQASALHGIVGKLMLHNESLVLSRQKSVESLLVEVREEYGMAMKYAIVEYRRDFYGEEEEKKLAHLALPPKIPRLLAPRLAVIDIPQRDISMQRALRQVEQLHYTHHPEATQVILALYRSWDSVKTGRFLDAQDDKLDLPLTLFEYQEHQESVFASQRERIQNDWRALVINLIRDNLNNVYKLFINDLDEYSNSELRRFLKMTGFMLRTQLTELMMQSMEEYVHAMVEKYSAPLAVKTAKLKEKHGADYELTDADVLQGYLGGAGVRTLEEEGTATGTRPLFVFKMSTSGTEVIFLPGLDSIELTLLGLVNIPSKLSSVCAIDSDVVPLLGLHDEPLCSVHAVPEVWRAADKHKQTLQHLITENLRQPLALRDLYAPFSSLLAIDTEAHVYEWFHPYEVEEKRRKEAAEKEGRDGKMNADGTTEDEDAAKNKTNNPWSLPGEDDAVRAAEEKAKAEADAARQREEERKRLGHSLAETEREIGKYFDAITTIQRLSPSEVTFKLVKIELSLVKEQLIAKAKEVGTKLLEGLAADIRQQNLDLTNKFEKMIARLRAKSTSVTELAELKSFSRAVETEEIPRLQKDIQTMQAKIQILVNFRYPLSRSDFNLSWNVNRYPLHLMEALEETKVTMETDNSFFQQQLAQEQAKFAQDLEEYHAAVAGFLEFGMGTTAQMEQYASKVEALQEKLERAEQQVASFNERDQLFGEQPMAYDELTEIKRKFKPFFDLWSTTSLFNGSYSVWMTGPFVELDPEQIGKDVSAWHKLMYKLERELLADDAVKPSQVASEMKAKISEFKAHLPIITWLRNPGLRQRHWDKISSILAPGRGSFLTPDLDLTLSQILALDIQAHKSEIEEISATASKEYQLELQLDKMNKEWRTVMLDIEPYKSTGSYILKGAEDILTLLDDQLMKTQAMRGSPYIKVWENRAKKWESKLQLVSSIMEEWLACQKTWAYLEPIFSSEDIMRQMPIESRRFGVVDAYWRKTMEAAKKNGNIMEFVTDTDNLLKTFQESNKMLDLIGKHLNEYLETKRLAMPRFYFLSNDELLSILSQTKNPQLVQPHLSKCFDAISLLHFHDATPDGASEKKEIITGMYSAEGEFVPFGETIDPNEGAKKGNVEIWLKEVERVMKETLKTVTAKYMLTYDKMSRSEWILDPKLPGQVCLSVCALYWTKQVTEALQPNSKGGVSAYMQQLNKQLEKLVELVRGDLTPLARATLGALTVMDVHARDVVAKMVEEGCKSDKDFEWLAQMRYYWEADQKRSALGGSSEAVPAGTLKVRMINTQMDYAYEYLGCTSRLVITPLTDRCYRTLMGAVHLHLGGAPEGPAGTGKTETVKDLSKAIAIQCVVFNCSDALNFRSMAKFFKGLAASGAWSCFDEFNRIELEVLSVIAQQISSIQRAILEGKHTFFFDNVNIPIIHTCSVFITMNPGYAGRAELPDNLKALFRTVAMMIPDYALIAEIVLYSYGYSAARQLARKIVGCLRLSSEQLSSQDHYDFGMRNVKSTLMAAGKLKGDYPTADEDWLIVRAISDCNVPKFVSADIPLFNGIVRDLFPTVEKRGNDRGELEESIRNTIEQFKLQPAPSFVNKCIELYDTFLVRHGLMLVGQTMSGKSSSLRVLQRSVSALAGKGDHAQVDVHYMNPKSVALHELYGADNPTTTEWVDGILPVVMRSCVAAQGSKWQWVVFDGPVDAIWIENMNTVLDDNKKLCLASGEQIKLAPFMSMVFEVEDLSQASPATVSRCGMVYCDVESLGWQVLCDSWLLTLHPLLQPFQSELRSLFHWLVPPCLEFLARRCKFMVPTSDLALVSSLCALLESLLDELKIILIKEKEREEAKKDEDEMTIPKLDANTADGNETSTVVASSSKSSPLDEQYEDQPEQRPQWLECSFIFSLIWSLGASTDSDGRAKFSTFLKDLLNGTVADSILSFDRKEYNGRQAKLSFPAPEHEKDHKDVYEFMYNRRANGMKGGWVNWMTIEPPYKIPEGANFHELIVPTIDTVRTNWLLDVLITHQHHVLLSGATGTGKSVCASQKLLHGLDRSIYLPFMLAFSARTSAAQTQDIIDGKLDRRRMGVLGPPPNRRCVIFVDDLNMPMREQYGAQPPIELLRQWMDYGGWYNRKQNTFTQIVDVQFVAAMGPPGGGRNPVTPRYLRHYNNICLTPYDDNSLKRIFSTIMRWWMEPFSAKVRSQLKALVDATVSIYTTISSQLLPTPAKSHYTFNLRDVSKVFQGIMSVDGAWLKEPVDLVRLWTHESARVFRDRLVDEEDIQWFQTVTDTQIKEHFKMEVDDVFPPDPDTGKPGDRRQIFCDFSNPRSTTRKYVEVRDMADLTKVTEAFLEDYNQVEKSQMPLVLFTSAIDHIARISRILRQPFGNALLVGVGGSGRQSLTKLASFIADYDCFQIEVTKNYSLADWREDLRDILRKAGIHNRPLVFLITDTQLKNESFWDDVNSILNNGEVPNLFPPEDYLPIIEAVLPEARKAGKADSNASVFGYFVERCRTNIHVVLCMSPIGAAFRTRLRQFPSLVNCCNINWFHAWSSEALIQVATRFLDDVPLEMDVKGGIIDVCVDMQERVRELSVDFLASLRRYNYVTPTSYLELIKLFRSLFEQTRTNIQLQEQRYRTGLKKIAETEVSVKTMQVELEALQPQLIQSSKETAELMVTIESRTAEVAKTRAVVTEEERACNEQAEAATKIKDECELQLAEAMPALNQAMKALRVLKKSDLDELKAMKVPTPGVLMTIEALCIMMGVQPKKVGEAGKERKNDYWSPAKTQLLNDPQLFLKLQKYDKDSIPESIIEKVRPYVKNPEFTPAKVAKASKAAEGFCKWVLSMEVYDRVASQVMPKRLALAKAQSSLQAASEQLAAKKAQLQQVQDMLDDLNAQFQLVNEKKKSLEAQVAECSARLDRAEKLLGGLANEKVRWDQRATQLALDYENVVGNILVSSGVIAYLGVFTSVYRDRCVNKWVELLQSKDIACASDFSLARVLGDPVAIRQWGIQQLPKDAFSIDNAIIAANSRRYPLMIDPQGQANRWIRQMEDEKSALKVIKQTDDQFLRTLSTCLQVGLPLLIENVGESLDNVLEPVLLKQTFKSGARQMIRVGSEVLAFDESFRLYITTRLQNPHYPPEIVTKITLINFMITPEGLEDQMLNVVVAAEEPELELERSELILKNAENQRQLQLIEDKILERLQNVEGQILDDEDLIVTLQKSKQAAKLIEKRVVAAAKMEENINKTRASYASVAFNSSNLFFCISDLGQVDPMYQFSLEYFHRMFNAAIKDADKSLDVHVRTNNIDKQFLRSLYKNVCRSLFEKDKLLFSFMLALRTLSARKQLDSNELRFLLTGGVGAIDRKFDPNPAIIDPDAPPFVLSEEDDEDEEEEEDEETEASAPAPVDPATASYERWLPDVNWQQIVQLSELSAFAGFSNHFKLHHRRWRHYYESNDPVSRSLPGSWESRLSQFQKLLVLRCFRPDFMTQAIQKMVAAMLGKEFITPPPFDLHTAYSDSDACSPLIFILSPGVDPVKDVYKLAYELGFSTPDRLFSISLGQGQGPLAESAIREAIDKGTWILLQNCHLAVSWLPILQKLVDEINPTTTNTDFRLWLTSMPSPHFPAAILQNGVKITNEPPKGIKANLAATYRAIDQQYLDECKQPEEHKRLLFGLSLFHAIVQERRKFGSIGYNIRYEFSAEDLSISKRQLKLFLDMYADEKELPIKALRYLIGQLNYGGRVTDDWDRRTITHVLDDFFTPRVMDEDYTFDAVGTYRPPHLGADLMEYRNLIQDLPQNDDADLFGLHENANTTTAIKESQAMFETLLALQPRTSSTGGLSRDATIATLARDIEAQLPPNFDIESAQRKYPVSYKDSMNTVLVQELVRFNRLLTAVKSSLIDIQKALKGEVVMSSELERMGDSMYNGQVPKLWSVVAYPSLKPLGAWVQDLKRRLKLFADWLEHGPPTVYWLSGFFFTQSFLTGTMQNYARAHQIAIDELSFDFQVMPHIHVTQQAKDANNATNSSDGCSVEAPTDGCYIYGLYLEGARWDDDGGHLVEPLRRQLYSEMPVIWLRPTETRKLPTDRLAYSCPVYKTSTRAGTLSTTGHSTNFVLAIQLTSKQQEKHWVKRGVALLTQLDF